MDDLHFGLPLLKPRQYQKSDEFTWRIWPWGISSTTAPSCFCVLRSPSEFVHKAGLLRFGSEIWIARHCATSMVRARQSDVVRKTAGLAETLLAINNIRDRWTVRNWSGRSCFFLEVNADLFPRLQRRRDAAQSVSPGSVEALPSCR